MMRSYSELTKLKTKEERFEYLKLSQKVGDSTFGSKRYLNQKFYTSREWKKVCHQVIARDNGCDMGLAGEEIPEGVQIHVHHMNPISDEDIVNGNPLILDPEYLITVSEDTHKAITYGNKNFLTRSAIVERKPFDTCPWKG